MKAATDTTPVARRDPATVMRLARLGSMHQSRLSFMRVLTRRMHRENWRFSRPNFDIDDNGVGYAVYCAHSPQNTYSLVAFAHDLPVEKRSDRVIAQAWDATFTLFDGVPDTDDINRLSQNIPLQEAGRVTQNELSVSRANRSVRLWEHVVSSLCAGQQPDRQQVAAVGYLMRTTAVYGSGKLGAADRELIADRPEFAAPFQAEMLSVFLTRAFVRDLVQHMADARGGARSVKLDPDIARAMGIGNSTGLGMAPFILNHPQLFNNWILAREEAIARVCNVVTASTDEIALFHELLARTVLSVKLWHTEHPVQLEKLASLQADLAALKTCVSATDLTCNHPWNRLYLWVENNLGIDAQECLASLMLEPYGYLVDELETHMADNTANTFHINGAMPIDQLSSLLQKHYYWALDIDWNARKNYARAWYVSAEKLEPRLGERFKEPIANYEQPLAPARDAARLFASLRNWPAESTLAEFLLHHPEHRHTVRRVQIISHAPYAEIRDNTISADMLPIDMLRCKLAFFGATHFDPRSDRWVRICMYANAPYPEELSNHDADYWPYPQLEESGS